jgi:hypothetical protein
MEQESGDSARVKAPKLDHAVLGLCHLAEEQKGDGPEGSPRMAGGFPVKQLIASRRGRRSTPWRHTQR